MSEIPVRNVWLLQLLASDLYRYFGRSLSSAELVDADVVELVSRLLAEALEQRLRTGLSTGFRRVTADLGRVRGRIDVLGTARGQLLTRGRVRCRFDELTVDTPTNRLVRSALLRAPQLGPADPRCAALSGELGARGISKEAPNPRVIAGLMRQRTAAADLPMISAARLIHELAVPTTSSGFLHTTAPEMNLDYLRRLFEKAALGAYRAALPDWQVTGGTWLRWDRSDDNVAAEKILPGMKTDIVLRPPHAPPIIMDTKFNNILAPNQWGTHRLRSGYLYQIYAYVMSQQDNPDFGPDTRGVLLHPVLGEAVDETVVIQGHPFRFATVDLWGSYAEILAGFESAVR